MRKAKQLKRSDFSIFYGDVTYFKKIYGIHNEYELALEPCLSGFDIALYKIEGQSYNLIGSKQCTNAQEITFGEQDRSPQIWSAALKIANEIIDTRLPAGIER